MKVLVLGDGLLGSEIVRQTGWDFVSRKKNGIDFCDLKSYYKYLIDYDVIFNAIGYTKTYSNEPDIHINTNFKAVVGLVNYCNQTDKKIIQISSDYVYANSKENATENDPPANCANWYAYSKMLGDAYVHTMAKKYLLLRTSFRPTPFPYPEISLQWGNSDYANVIATLIIELIDKDACGIFNVGRSMPWSNIEMAFKTRNDVRVRKNKVFDSIPDDITMDVSKMVKFLSESK
jgi:nucleoside-diphosphate-sugar epimerase